MALISIMTMANDLWLVSWKHFWGATAAIVSRFFRKFSTTLYQEAQNFDNFLCRDFI